ncbi:MAG TPA: hypothetical protein VFX74_08625 [Candidatus Limnocylindria bacterium]|jgi:hypothetical protein|nr:hypothetical protein [Candidatus Limnocylindria bacterium]
MTPWLLLTAFTATLNLLAFIWIRGRWGRVVPFLALASVLGAMLGNAIGERIGFDLLRIGDFRLLAASIVAQLAMLAVVLFGTMAPRRIEID